MLHIWMILAGAHMGKHAHKHLQAETHDWNILSVFQTTGSEAFMNFYCLEDWLTHWLSSPLPQFRSSGPATVLLEPGIKWCRHSGPRSRLWRTRPCFSSLPCACQLPSSSQLSLNVINSLLLVCFLSTWLLLPNEQKEVQKGRVMTQWYEREC